jgi:inner membrane transporter RhtA
MGERELRGSRLDAVPPELLVLTGTVSAQVGGGIATPLIRQHGPLPVVAMRLTFAAIALVLFQRLRLRGASRAALLSGVALGAALAAMNTSFYVAISRIPLGVAVTIEFCGPLAVAVLGSRRWLDLVWVVLAGAGIYVLAGGRIEAGDLKGVAAAFASGACWATYIVVGSRVAREWPDGRGLTLAMVVAAALIAPVVLIGSDVRTVLTGPVLAGGLVIALFSSAIPYAAEIAALRRLRAATFGVLMSLEPAVAALVGFLLLGQVLGSVEVAAIACVAIASAGASISARRLTTTLGELEAT